MGSCLSSSDAAATALPIKTASETASTESNSTLADYQLKKRRPGCSGMFWREDPTGKIQLTGGENWPQDDAIIKGRVIVDSGGDKWIHAVKIKQNGVGPWLPVPHGAFIPFEYDDHYYLEAV